MLASREKNEKEREEVAKEREEVPKEREDVAKVSGTPRSAADNYVRTLLGAGHCVRQPI